MMSIPGLFIVGTDTGVGKTFVTSLLIKECLRMGLRVGAYKPACSGCEFVTDSEGVSHPIWSDIEIICTALGRNDIGNSVCPQRFQAPAAPPVAARMEGKRVDRQLLDKGLEDWKDRCNCLLIEGIGGLLCPVTDAASIADLAADWKFPLLIVGRAGLGTINHTLLTVEAAQRRQLAIAGVILNETTPSADDTISCWNPHEIARRTDVPVWGVIPHDARSWSSLRNPLNYELDLSKVMIRAEL